MRKAIKEYLSSGHYRRRLEKIRAVHRDRRDYMLKLLLQQFPSNTTWTVPDVGTFLWIQLPDEVDVGELSAAAAKQRVLVGSGAAFFPKNQGYSAMRLNFSLPPEETERGIKKLGEILRKMVG